MESPSLLQKPVVAAALIMCWCVLAPSRVFAAEPPTITVNGSVETKLKPSFVRLQFGIVAEEEDVARALELLAKRRQQATSLMQKLHPIANSLTFNEPEKWTSRKSPTPSPIPAGPLPGSRLRTFPPPVESAATDADAKKEVLFQTAHVDFPYLATIAETQAFGDQLLKRLEKDDLAGIRNLTDKSICTTCGSSPIAPMFMAVARPSREHYTKIYAQALGRASAVAGSIAAAEDMKLGSLKNISCAHGNNDPGAVFARAVAFGNSSEGGDGFEPLAGPGLGLVKHRIAVTVTFTLEK